MMAAHCCEMVCAQQAFNQVSKVAKQSQALKEWPLMLQALELRIQKNIAKKGDSIKLKPVSAHKVSAHKSHQSPTK